MDEQPFEVTRVLPEYPDIAKQAGIEGTVHVQALVGRDGRIEDIRIVRSIPILDEAAEKAVRRWRFTPAKTNGHPVRVWVSIPVRFTLRGD